MNLKVESHEIEPVTRALAGAYLSPSVFDALNALIGRAVRRVERGDSAAETLTLGFSVKLDEDALVVVKMTEKAGQTRQLEWRPTQGGQMRLPELRGE